jgi:hypothetical protein
MTIFRTLIGASSIFFVHTLVAMENTGACQQNPSSFQLSVFIKGGQPSKILSAQVLNKVPNLTTLATSLAHTQETNQPCISLHDLKAALYIGNDTTDTIFPDIAEKLLNNIANITALADNYIDLFIKHQKSIVDSWVYSLGLPLNTNIAGQPLYLNNDIIPFILHYGVTDPKKAIVNPQTYINLSEQEVREFLPFLLNNQSQTLLTELEKQSYTVRLYIGKIAALCSFPIMEDLKARRLFSDALVHTFMNFSENENLFFNDIPLKQLYPFIATENNNITLGEIDPAFMPCLDAILRAATSLEGYSKIKIVYGFAQLLNFMHFFRLRYHLTPYPFSQLFQTSDDYDYFETLGSSYIQRLLGPSALLRLAIQIVLKNQPFENLGKKDYLGTALTAKCSNEENSPGMAMIIKEDFLLPQYSCITYTDTDDGFVEKVLLGTSSTKDPCFAYNSARLVYCTPQKSNDPTCQYSKFDLYKLNLIGSTLDHNSLLCAAPIKAISFNALHSRLFVAYYESIQVIDVEKKQNLKSYPVKNTQFISNSPRGNIIAAATDKEVHFFNVDNDQTHVVISENPRSEPRFMREKSYGQHRLSVFLHDQNGIKKGYPGSFWQLIATGNINTYTYIPYLDLCALVYNDKPNLCKLISVADNQEICTINAENTITHIAANADSLMVAMQPDSTKVTLQVFSLQKLVKASFWLGKQTPLDLLFLQEVIQAHGRGEKLFIVSPEQQEIYNRLMENFDIREYIRKTVEFI